MSRETGSYARSRRAREIALACAIACLLALAGAGSALASTTTYTATETIPVPPAPTYAGIIGGDGGAVALSNTQVFNVFYQGLTMQVACHNQSDASRCWPTDSETITDASGNNFAASDQPGLYLDQKTGKLYVFATRSSDGTAGVVCIDTTIAATNPNPFCGYTPLTAPGDGPIDAGGISGTSEPMLIGTKWYSFNYVDSAATSGGKNHLLCFDVSTDAACAGQPFAVAIGSGTVSTTGFPVPADAAIGDHLIIPITVAGVVELACWNATTGGNCAGTWPVSASSISDYPGNAGSPIPLLDSTGNVTGVCAPLLSVPCFTLAGVPAATPPGLASTIMATGSSSSWDGPAAQLGPRIYIPEWSTGVACYDYSTGAPCANFPKQFINLELVYSVNRDPQRPTCLWVNSDNGTSQIQNFDAYTGGPCGQSPIRVLASQFVVGGSQCTPTSYTKIQVLQPDPTTYNATGSTLDMDDGDGNPITTISPNPLKLDSTGSVNLTGLGLNSATGLPQFAFTLNGVTGPTPSVKVQLTWAASSDPSCNPNSAQPDSDLALHGVPANITTNATGPGGATVNYTPPTATDESEETPPVSCNPPSGSKFAIGTTTVTCTASDADDLNSPVSATFTVTVKQAPTALVSAPQLVVFPPPVGVGLFEVTAALSSYGMPVAGRTITFSVGSTRLCTTSTNAVGFARCTIGVAAGLRVLLSNGYSASFAGDATHLGMSASAPAVELGHGPTGLGHANVSAIWIERIALTRGRVLYATVAPAGHGRARATLSVRHRLTAGRYTLTLTLHGHAPISKTITLP